MTRTLAAALLLALVLSPAPAAAQFDYLPSGDLAPGSGDGRADDMVYAPGIRFPIEDGPAYANSQVWGVGGSEGPSGSQCDARNYGYPWRDNYCESRSWDMPMCPSGTGHQGQDIRPGTCEDEAHWGVAADDGTITNVGSYSVYLTTDDGRRYDYLHMNSVAVSVGDRVVRGQHLGRVSNNFGGDVTTIHLHFNIRMTVSGYGSVYAPTYQSLIQSYQVLIGEMPEPPPPPPPPPPPGGASCTHSFGGIYADHACSESYQCCDGTWRMRTSGCGECVCVEPTGMIGCSPPEPPPPPPPGDTDAGGAPTPDAGAPSPAPDAGSTPPDLDGGPGGGRSFDRGGASGCGCDAAGARESATAPILPALSLLLLAALARVFRRSTAAGARARGRCPARGASAGAASPASDRR